MLDRRALLALMTASVLSSCDSGPRKSSGGKRTVAIAYALGGKGDQSYNDAAVGALPRLAELFDVREFSPLTLEDYAKALTTVAAARPSIIFCIGFIYDTFVNKLASSYPDMLFCVLDGSPSTASNTLGVQFKVAEASSLAGVVAADVSKTKHIAFVGGSDIPPIREFLQGYEIGAKRLHPSIRIDSSYIGAGAEAFTNASRGKDIALRLIDAGADVLFHAAGSSGNGVIAAARDRRIRAIGVDVDQTHLAPSTVITNVIKRLDTAILRIAEASNRGEAVKPGVIRLGLAEGGVEITNPPPLSDVARNMLATFRSEFGATR